MVTTASASATATAASLARVAPRSSALASAASLKSKARTSCPALTRFAAIPPPMLPSPMNAILAIYLFLLTKSRRSQPTNPPRAPKPAVTTKALPAAGHTAVLRVPPAASRVGSPPGTPAIRATTSGCKRVQRAMTADRAVIVTRNAARYSMSSWPTAPSTAPAASRRTQPCLPSGPASRTSHGTAAART